MNQSEVAQGLIEQCQAGAPVDVLPHAFQRCTEALGSRHFACCSHVDPLKSRRRAMMFHEARRYLLTRGFIVSIHPIDAPRDFHASCSVTPNSESLEPAAYSAVQVIAFYMSDAASNDVQAKDPSRVQRPLSVRERLSRRERQCLELAIDSARRCSWMSTSRPYR